MSHLLRDIKVIDRETKRIATILIEDHDCREINTNRVNQFKGKVTDSDGLCLIPSFVDMHCHLRDPGFTYKEDLQSGQLAALGGGFTTLCSMANTNPICDNEKTIRYIINKARMLGLCEIIPISAVTCTFQMKQLVDFKKMTRYTSLFSNDGKPITDEDVMIAALKASSQYNFTLLTHCEPETEMIYRDLKLLEKFGGNLHICHVSKKESVAKIRDFKQKGLKFTCEVTPHHLCSYGLDYVVHPPFRAKEDSEALLAGLLDGTIDIIATDHAPHSQKDKINGARGLIGFEHAFSLVYTRFREKNIDLKYLIQFMSAVPAKLLGKKPGSLQDLSTADFVLVDLNAQYNIQEKDIVSKSKNTPFLGKKVFGKVLMTIKNGKVKYDYR